jgi:uncharacterized protein YecT (DUF1311 family)
MDTAETQMDMNSCAASKADATDKEMNRLYRKLLESYKADQKAVARFRVAQRAWLKYRDAQLATYSEMRGSGSNVCVYLQRATDSRTNQVAENNPGAARRGCLLLPNAKRLSR